VAEAVREVPRVSADVMFGMPDQTPALLRDELERLVELGVKHVSAYALTIEPRTPSYERAQKGRLPIASDEVSMDLFEAAETGLADLGFAHYEVSNYAQPGEEARHNLHYWRGGPYLGLGAAAVGCLDMGV